MHCRHLARLCAQPPDRCFWWTRRMWSFYGEGQRQRYEIFLGTYHIVDSAEDLATVFVLAANLRVVLLLVSKAILLARKASTGGLGAAIVATEEGLCVSLVVLTKIAASRESCSRSASTVGTGPGPVSVARTPSGHLCSVR